MELKVLGSSSSGNCYILDNGNEALIIEAGIRFQEVKKVLGFNLRKVVGCLISHQHGDHAKYIKAMVESGIYTLALPEVWENKAISGSRAITIQPQKVYRLGGFTVMPFSAVHDVPCVGYLINHKACGKVLFLTDSCICEYTFAGLNHILVECNYTDESLIRAIYEGRTLPSQRERLMTSHMELQTTKEFLAANDLSQVSNIVLLHLSDNNSNERMMISEIEKQTGKAVYVADPGLTINVDRI